MACTMPAGQPWSIAMTKRASAAWRSALSALHWPKSSSTMVPSSCRSPHPRSAAHGRPVCSTACRPVSLLSMPGSAGTARRSAISLTLAKVQQHCGAIPLQSTIPLLSSGLRLFLQAMLNACSPIVSISLTDSNGHSPARQLCTTH